MASEAFSRESGLLFLLAMQASLDGFWALDIASGEVYYSPRWQKIAGCEPVEFSGSLAHWLERVHHEDRPRLDAELRALRAGKSKSIRNEHRMRDELGLWRWVMVRGVSEMNEAGAVIRIGGSMTDNMERKMSDPLTGLPNRMYFIDHLERRIDRARRLGAWDFAVLSVGLERFKMVNERLGYTGGDALLMETASRLTDAIAHRVVPGDSVIARLSGADFLVCLEGVDGESQAIEVAKGINGELRRPFEWRCKRISPAAAMGLAHAEGGVAHPEDLMRDADTALMEARSRGLGRLVCYSSGMRERALARMQMEADLEQAIRTGQLVLYYQPEIDLATRNIVGFEALVRWQHPERGLISPGEFIPLAEETGLILPLGDWGLTEACRQIVAWRGLGKRPDVDLRVSVNLSGKQFGRPGLVRRVEEILQKTQVAAADLRLEVTESSLISNADAALRTMHGLREIGVGLHMDDFGTGYSSLNHLHRYPFDTLKIDRSFIQGIADEHESAEIVKTILDLAHSLHMEVVAEGIETQEQMEVLRGLGCRFGQGYYFAKPMDPDVISTMLATPGDAGYRIAGSDRPN